MPAVGALFALLVAVSIAGAVGLWYAIDRETDGAPTMDRRDAERAARQDTDEADRPTDDADHWGTDSEWGVDDDRR